MNCGEDIFREEINVTQTLIDKNRTHGVYRDV